MTATVGYLGQVIAIVVVVLITLGILIWARWDRARREAKRSQDRQ
jgi:hypothetical protein